MDQFVAMGFDLLYNLDYDRAGEVFGQIISAYPDNPAGYCYMSTNIWLKLLNERQELEVGNFTSAAYFDRKSDRPVDPEIEREFDRNVNAAIAKAESILRADPDNVHALYFLGAAYGNIGAYHATVQRSVWTAFRSGTKAYDCHKKVLALAPQFYDANLSVGLYEYIAGSIPWSVRWLAALAGYRGDKNAGLEKLQLAATKARHNRKDAQVIAIVLLVREKRYDEALAYLGPLQREFPGNHLLSVDLAGLQMLAGKPADAAATYREILSRIEEGRPHFKRLPPQKIYLRLGNALLASNQAAEALDAFNHVLTQAAGGSMELTLGHLRMGQVADLLDDRPKAMAHYQKVLLLPDFQDSRDQAKRYLKKPYRL